MQKLQKDFFWKSDGERIYNIYFIKNNAYKKHTWNEHMKH